MQLILHIGMGKTGSSAIQHALAANAEHLIGQGVEYLGMWFDMLDPGFRGVQNQGRFFAMAPPEMEEATRSLLSILKARAAEHGIGTFILSNEAFSGQARTLAPMIGLLQSEGVDVRAIGYARNPAAWLPSAYVQWGVRDKVEPGPVQPYREKARKLVRWYAGLLAWAEQMGDILTVRAYDQASDIVADFAKAAGITLAGPGKRVLERGEDAEIVLRALYNNRFPKHVLPAAFDRAVMPGLAAVPHLEDVIGQCFDYSETDRIVAENAELFDRFTGVFGFDPRASGKTPPSMPSIGPLRDRLVDALLEITLDQARRMQRMERRLSQLEQQARSAPESD
jgi:hypothetical protein